MIFEIFYTNYIEGRIKVIAMIIWINGSFGVGKTTVANKLKNNIDKSIIYDPEKIGTFLSNTLPIQETDFQDYKLWRTLNYEILKYLSGKFEIILVPMTITNSQYFDEIVSKLEKEGINIKHFILVATKENIIKRLNSRENSTEWTYMQVDRCVNTFESYNCRGKKIDTNNQSVDEVVDNIIKLINN